jgi:hydroxymethylpyrimidine pyrophosphatase-like HAD family hydrolase
MMKKEFEKLIGLEIKQEEYEPIEAYYMSLPESIDKQKFAESWLKDGGIQKLFDKRLEGYFILRARYNDLAEQLENQAEDNWELIRQSNEQANRIRELEEKLAAINTLTKGNAA